MAAPLISLRDASVAHRDGVPPVIHEVSLDVHRGDWIAVAGDNGSGKTTLLAALAGLLPLRSGSVRREDGMRTALLLQEPDNQLVASSVAHELALSVPRHTDAVFEHARIDAAIERFQLEDVLERNPHRLSGGEKQRLAFATVWLESPDVLLLDEPLSYLDDEMRANVLAFVRELNSNGVAVVWATPGDDVMLARDVVWLEKGRVVDRATPEVRTTTESSRGDGDRTTRRERHAVSAERMRLGCESVAFAYDRRVVLSNVTMSVSAGECVQIAGPNGSGKSTLLLLAGGALKPWRGRIHRDVRAHGVLYLPQSPERLFFAETVREEIAFGLQRRGVSGDAARVRTEAALTEADLNPVDVAARSPFELSVGEMRRVAFAIAFALEPELLLLDEPTSCLDAAGRVVLNRLIRTRTREGAAVLTAAHAGTAEIWHSRLLELRNGRIQ
ncbi:MAG TPA: ATP-binding cassette domain-containing protein [Candidatus Krumholzibacteria bacterium]|nr:ATP-binding cassette domain-containing protein [Candidatus Krumholzibacteria bacterium]